MEDVGRMKFTQQDIDSFHRFAVEKLSNGATEFTLEECLCMWRTEREEAETVDSVRRGEQDIEAGRHHTLDEVGEEIRKRFGRTPQNQTS